MCLTTICRSVIKEQVLQSKQMGRRENKHVNFEGRVPFDLLLVSYKYFLAEWINLNTVELFRTSFRTTDPLTPQLPLHESFLTSIFEQCPTSCQFRQNLNQKEESHSFQMICNTCFAFMKTRSRSWCFLLSL